MSLYDVFFTVCQRPQWIILMNQENREASRRS